PHVRPRAIAAHERNACAWLRHPPFLPHVTREGVRVLVRQLAADLARAIAVGAAEDSAAFHYFSPAAGKTGVMSTGMSFSRAFTASISAFVTPYFVSSAFARLKSPVASIVSSSVASDFTPSRNLSKSTLKRPFADGTM